MYIYEIYLVRVRIIPLPTKFIGAQTIHQQHDNIDFAPTIVSREENIPELGGPLIKYRSKLTSINGNASALSYGALPSKSRLIP